MAKARARPIKTQQDYRRALSAAKKTIQESRNESAEESRLQALLDELERFDEDDDDDISPDAAENFDGVPRRRWSDDPSNAE